MTTEPQTATERAREIIRTTLVWNLHAMFGESHDKATEEVIAALHDAGLMIVEKDRDWKKDAAAEVFSYADAIRWSSKDTDDD